MILDECTARFCGLQTLPIPADGSYTQICLLYGLRNWRSLCWNKTISTP